MRATYEWVWVVPLGSCPEKWVWGCRVRPWWLLLRRRLRAHCSVLRRRVVPATGTTVSQCTPWTAARSSAPSQTRNHRFSPARAKSGCSQASSRGESSRFRACNLFLLTPGILSWKSTPRAKLCSFVLSCCKTGTNFTLYTQTPNAPTHFL